MPTGAGSGIGRATALAFASEGARLIVGDVNEPDGLATVAAVQERGAEAEFVRADVSRSGDCAAMVERALRRFGRLDVAFNNAGINLPVAPIAEVKESDWERILAINLTGVYLCMKHEIPAMKRGGGGAIFAIITSIGLTGIASRFSIVPRSRSLVIAIVVTNRVENISTMQTRPGTTLSTVSCSGL